ncbi:MAG: riboflavin synthase subunit alpha [Enterobacterales bacterium]
MFSGIIKYNGFIYKIKKKENLYMYFVKLPKNFSNKLEIGSSISCNGCCLTIHTIQKNIVSFCIIYETIKVTNLGHINIGNKINLEKPISLSKEISGHVMSGHIICTAKVINIINVANKYQIWFKLSNLYFFKYIFYKGYIGIDGVSLTIGNINNFSFCVNLIPDTLINTTLIDKNIGSIVNIEISSNIQATVDTVERILNKKYFEKFLK